MSIKIGIAGAGAIGCAVARALTNSSDFGGCLLHAISDPAPKADFYVPNVSFDVLADQCDLVIECLPAHIVPILAEACFARNTDIIFISSAALLLYPQVVDNLKRSASKAYLPSGALCGLDGVRAMKEMGIESAKISSTKPPLGFVGAPYIEKNDINLQLVSKKSMLFKGNALEASEGFPANINVAATLSLAGIGAEDTMVEIWADPDATGNSHEITVSSKYSTINARVENMPDPMNPKSSVLAAQSIVACLRNMNNALVIG
ncbi:MAG: aspartate dehydrogenase domain-containing protein [Alphaproteobacteria bacterium]